MTLSILIGLTGQIQENPRKHLRKDLMLPQLSQRDLAGREGCHGCLDKILLGGGGGVYIYSNV